MMRETIVNLLEVHPFATLFAALFIVFVILPLALDILVNGR